MRTIEFAPLGRTTSPIGLGCGRLVGRSSLRRSAQLVEAALDLGIRYFDVAPSYGLGTAEEVIGQVIGDSKEVAIATKVGVPRPAYSERTDRLRRLVKSVLDRAPLLKRMALRTAGAPPVERPRYDFSESAVRASLETSLRLLRRSSIDVFLAHEPHRLDLSEQTAGVFQRLRDEGQIRAFGVGIGAVSEPWQPFGSIWQSCWPGMEASVHASGPSRIWHGAVRHASSRSSGARVPPSAVVRQVVTSCPNSILLVSASTPGRLRELLSEVDP